MQITEESVLAPAKVNLCLRVLGRRADGYHLLDSIFVSVSLYDRLHLRLTPPPHLVAAKPCDPQRRVGGCTG